MGKTPMYGKRMEPVWQAYGTLAGRGVLRFYAFGEDIWGQLEGWGSIGVTKSFR